MFSINEKQNISHVINDLERKRDVDKNTKYYDKRKKNVTFAPNKMVKLFDLYEEEIINEVQFKQKIKSITID